MKSSLVRATVILLGIALAACNQQTNKNQNAQRGGHGLKRACATEIQQYCAGQRGRERRTCLQDHMSQLSDSCKSAVQARGKGGRMGRIGRKHLRF